MTRSRMSESRGSSGSCLPYHPPRAAGYNRTVTLSYNIAILAVDVVAIWLLRRYRGLWAWCFVVGGAEAIALIFGVALGSRFEDGFGVLRLWTFGIFLHGPILLIAAAIFAWRSRRWLNCLAAAAIAVLAAVAVDAFLIEPTWLEVSHRRIASAKIHKPLRIVVIADLQADSIGPYERRVLRKALDERPDVVLWAGDYIQPSSRPFSDMRQELNGFLRDFGFRSPLKMFAVQGNCEPGRWESIFDGTGATVVSGEETFDLGDLRVTCLRFYESASPSLTITNDAPDRFHVVLGHMPNFALGKIDADLLVAGHTHGGQVQLPFIGPVLTLSLVPRAWASGLTELPGGGKLFVSRGIGMERGYAPCIRFNCRPELAVIDLIPERKGTADEQRETED